jgi:PleD family two-component response regulator
VTASAGAAHWSPQLAGPLDLLNAADAALYEAKRSGRAQARSWSDLTPPVAALKTASARS